MLWSSDPRSLSALSATSLHVLSIQDLRFGFNKQVAAIQASSDTVTLLPSKSRRSEKRSPKRAAGVCEVGIGSQIFGFSLWGHNLLCWSNKQATVFEVTTSDTSKGESVSAAKVSSFQIDIPSTHVHILPSSALAVHQSCAYAITGSKVNCIDFTGKILSHVGFDDVHGSPTHVTISNDTLVVITLNKYVKVIKICDSGLVQTPQKGGQKPNATRVGRKMVVDGKEIGEVRQISCNSSGTCVAVLAEDLEPAPAGARSRAQGPSHSCDSLKVGNTLIVYDTVTDKILWYDLGTSQGSKPLSVSWDVSDPRLLAVQTRPAPQAKGSPERASDLEITTFFVCPNDKYSKNDYSYGIYVQVSLDA